MEKDGVVYGYSLADRIAERTGSAWRPGPGAVYPALRRLSERGLATSRGEGRRREYRISPRGRQLLRQIRRERSGSGSSGPDLGVLWADILGISDDSTFLLQRLRRSLDGLEAQLVRNPGARVGTRSLRDHILLELRAAERRFEVPVSRPARSRASRRRTA
jgi:DNA-binding PadR family transcriptional regulator